MKKLISSILVIAFVATGVLLYPAQAFASVNYNRLIDDSVFSNSNKMTATQINSFLNSFSSSCISTNKGFKAPAPTGYNPTDGFLYGSNVSAGKVIYDAAQAYDLNPQVLLATLQKEQGYVSGPGYYNCTDPLSSSAKKGYAQAMGYGCPDGGTTHNYNGTNLYTIGSTTVTAVAGTCVSSKSMAGFSQQIIRAAWLLKFGQQRSLGNTDWAVIKGNWDNSDDPGSCYAGPMTQGYRKRCSSDSTTTYYDGYTTIDSSSIHMDTGATAALYWYTPHKAGNQNFFNIFSGWFGNPATDTTKDIPIVGDWDITKDGFDSPAIKRGDLYYFDNDMDGTEDITFGIGRSTDQVIVGDWDGDGDKSIGLKRGDHYYLLKTGGSVHYSFGFGRPTDQAIVGDWDGDGIDTIGLKRGSDYYFDNDNTDTDRKADAKVSIGRTTDGVVVGDWDGDGKDSIGLKRGKYYFLLSEPGSVYKAFGIGRTTDGALVGDWDGDVKDEIGLKRGAYYYLLNSDGGVAYFFGMGRVTDKTIVGNWDGLSGDSVGLKRASNYYLDNNNDGVADVAFVYTY